MRRIAVSILALFWLSTVAGAVRAGDVEGLVGIYSEDNAKGYMQPLADALGANMNSGFWRDARIPADGFHIYLGVQTMVTPIADEDRTFLAHTESEFSSANGTSVVQAPTIFGPSEGREIAGTGGTAFVFPGGLAVTRLPLAVPQIEIGSVRGTQAVARFVDVEVNDSIKKVRLLGLGLRHSLSQYFPNLPVDVAAGAVWQQFKVEDFIKAQTLSLGLQGGITRGPLSLLAGVDYEKASLDLDYPRGSEGAGNVSFSLDGANSVRLTAGAALSLSVVKLNVDYSLASQSVLTVGLGLGQ